MHGPLALVQFDAHQDTWPTTASASTTAPSSPAPCARASSIPTARSRSASAPTRPRIAAIKIIYGHEVEEMRASDIAYAIIERTGGKKTYLTFDIDCLDPAFAPGTGTPVAGGPCSAKILSVLRQLDQDRHRRRRRGRGCAGLRSCRYHGDRRRRRSRCTISACWPSRRRGRTARTLNQRLAGRFRKRLQVTETLDFRRNDWHETENLHRRRTRHDRPADQDAAGRPRRYRDHLDSEPSAARTRPRAPNSSTPPTSRSCACPTMRRSESVALIANDDTRVIDASTAHRVADGWAYGFAEMDKDQAARHRQGEARRQSRLLAARPDRDAAAADRGRPAARRLSRSP